MQPRTLLEQVHTSHHIGFTQLLAEIYISDAVSINPAKENEITTTTIRHLIDAYTRYRSAPPVTAQLEAIDYIINNFINDDDRDLLFVHINKGMLALHLIIRVLIPMEIEQSDKFLCGPTSFIQTIACDAPLAYVKFVTELAITGKSVLKISDEAKGIKIKISDKSLFKWSRYSRDNLNPADFIPIVGLRSSTNLFFSFHETGSIHKLVPYGITLPGSIKEWMRAVGYENVKNITIKSSADIQGLHQRIQSGSSCIYLTSGQLAGIIKNMNEIPKKMPSKVGTIIYSHFVKLNEIRYDAEDDEVRFSIMTWGFKRDNIGVDYKDFAKTKGLSIATIGIRPQKQLALQQVAGIDKKADSQKKSERTMKMM